MNNFGTLYFYELKKILMKKLTCITLAVMIGLLIFAQISDNRSVKK